MARGFIAGPATVDMWADDIYLGHAITIIDSSIAIGTSVEEFRAGPGNMLFGKYYHTSTFDVTLTDGLFSLENLANATGSKISVGKDTSVTDNVVLGAGNTGSVKNVPAEYGIYGTIGWIRLAGQDNWTTVTFTGKNFVSPVGQPGDTVCVRYLTFNSSARTMRVNANFIPRTIRLLMTASLFNGDPANVQSATKIGNVEIEVPKFQFAGSADLSMTTTGISNTPLSGSALVVEDNKSCDVQGYYADITEVLFEGAWYDNIRMLAIEGEPFEIAAAEGTKKLNLYAVPISGDTFLVRSAQLDDVEFASSDTAVVKVDGDGVVEFVGAGDAVITATVTNKPSLTTQVNVEASV